MRFCPSCDNCRWGCEAHRDRQWDGAHACGWGAPSEPCPLCNRADEDTVPELPDGFVVDIKNADWGLTNFIAVARNSTVGQIVERGPPAQTAIAGGPVGPLPIALPSTGALARRYQSGAEAMRFLHRPCADRYPPSRIRNPEQWCLSLSHPPQTDRTTSRGRTPLRRRYARLPCQAKPSGIKAGEIAGRQLHVLQQYQPLPAKKRKPRL